MIIQWNNIIDSTTTIVASSEKADFPVSNIYDTYASQYFQFTGYTDENIIFDAGVGETFDIDSLAIVNHNLTDSATVTLQANATDSWTSPSFTQSATSIDEIVQVFATATQSYRYVRLRLQDTSNTTGIYMGYVWIGEKLDIETIQRGTGIPINITTQQNITKTGEVGGTGIYSNQIYSLNFRHIELTEKNQIDLMFKTNGNYRPMIMTLWEQDTVDGVKKTAYVIMQDTAINWQRTTDNKYSFSTSLNFREVF